MLRSTRASLVNKHCNNAMFFRRNIIFKSGFRNISKSKMNAFDRFSSTREFSSTSKSIFFKSSKNLKLLMPQQLTNLQPRRNVTMFKILAKAVPARLIGVPVAFGAAIAQGYESVRNQVTLPDLGIGTMNEKLINGIFDFVIESVQKKKGGNESKETDEILITPVKRRCEVANSLDKVVEAMEDNEIATIIGFGMLTGKDDFDALLTKYDDSKIRLKERRKARKLLEFNANNKITDITGLMNRSEGFMFKNAMLYELFKKNQENKEQFSSLLVLDTALKVLIHLGLEDEAWPVPHDSSAVQLLVNKTMLGNGALQPCKLDEMSKKRKSKPVNLNSYQFPYQDLKAYFKDQPTVKQKNEPKYREMKGVYENHKTEIEFHAPFWCFDIKGFKTKAVKTTLGTSSTKQTARQSKMKKV
eukprot:Pgem_evm1s4548